ncbi:transposase [Microbulbifer thermotolerans]|uniref:transposase n=1 Tax=Microbulbifer thermotolerans TaxID=252514 RepID=UPI00396A9329
MKMHIGVDESLGLIHSVETTPENEHDLNVAHKLLHGDEQRVWADAGYGGAKKLKSLKNGTWNGLLVCAQAHVKSLVVHIQKSREDKGQCSGQSRACFLLYQTHVWLQQDSLSRFGEKHQSPLCVIGVGELTSLSKISAGLGPVCLKSA